MAQAIEDILDDIVAALTDAANVAEFPEDLTAAGRVRWEYVNSKKYKDYTTDPEVVIYPREEINEQDDRQDARFRFTVVLAVVRKVDGYDKATIQPLLALPRAVRDFLREKDMAGCEWENTTLEVLYGHDELKQDATLVSTIRSEYWIDQ